MKKMSIFGLLALLVLSLASVAQAADIKATGKWQIEAQWNNDLDFASAGAQGNTNAFHIEQRMRTAFQFIANENLKAVLDTQIGSTSWGNGMLGVGAGRSPAGAGGNASVAGAGNIMLRQGYLDFKWPNTKLNFKVGYQVVSLPAAFGGGSAIFDDVAAGAIVSTPVIDHVNLLAGYIRAADTNAYGSTAANANTGTSMDVAFAAVPVDFKGVNITPFAAFAYAGHSTGQAASAGFASSYASNANNDGVRGYWGGAAFTMTAFEPFKVMADFNYGKATYNSYSDKNEGGRSGYLFDLAVDYTGLSMMTPELFYVYSSGESGDTSTKSGRMPVMGNPQSWSVGSFFFGDRNFITGFATTSTSAGYSGYVRNVMGFWTAGVSLKDIKLIDKLSHTFNVLYIKGTNSADYLNTVAARRPGANYGAFLTDKDHLWEVDLNTKYQIYDALALQLDLGYINASMDKDTWRQVNAVYANDSYLTTNAYRVAMGLNYSF